MPPLEGLIGICAASRFVFGLGGLAATIRSDRELDHPFQKLKSGRSTVRGWQFPVVTLPMAWSLAPTQ
jgi:hypothetical protein